MTGPRILLLLPCLDDIIIDSNPLEPQLMPQVHFYDYDDTPWLGRVIEELAWGFRVLESIKIRVGSMAAGRWVWYKSSILELTSWEIITRQRDNWGWYRLWKPQSLPQWHTSIIKSFHQLRIKYSNIYAYREHSHSNYHILIPGPIGSGHIIMPNYKLK